MKLRATWLGIIMLLALGRPASAIIERMYTLDEVLDECTNILVGRVTAIDPDARTVVLTIDKALKGDAEYKHVNLNIGVGPQPHGRYVLERLEAEAPAIVFYKRTDATIACEVFAGGIWFQFSANDEPANRDKVWWSFTHVELRMNRTFHATTSDLVKLVDDVLAKRAKAPAPDPAVPMIDVNVGAVKMVAAVRPGDSAAGFHRQLQLNHAEGDVGGISFADVNGDGFLDIYVVGGNGSLLLLREGNSYTEARQKLGLPVSGSRATSWADYNGDGKPDLLTSSSELFTLLGDQFKDDSALLPKLGDSATVSAGWIDYNGDGRPDLLIATGVGGLRLFENIADSAHPFKEVSIPAGLGPHGLGAGNGNYLTFFDYDGDGNSDILYNLGPGVLAHNQGNGAFRQESSSGIELPGGSDFPRGVAAADYDDDGNVDLFVPGPGKARLYHNNNDGAFTDVIDVSGDLAKVGDASYSAAWGDFNGDGNLDLVVCHPEGPVRLYLGDGRGHFTDVTKDMGLEKLRGVQTAAFADLDNDGDLDLVLSLRDKVVIAFNDLPRPTDRRPVSVQVKTSRGLTGAVVRVQDGRGRPLGLRELAGAEGCGGEACPVAFFAVPLRPCQVFVALSDGRLAGKTIPQQADNKPVTLTFTDSDFPEAKLTR